MAASPSDELTNLGGLSLYQADEVIPDIPEYVSSGDDASAVGSSVSQTKQTTVEVSAAMFENAIAIVTDLRQEVRLFISIQYINN